MFDTSSSISREKSKGKDDRSKEDETREEETRYVYNFRGRENDEEMITRRGFFETRIRSPK